MDLPRLMATLAERARSPDARWDAHVDFLRSLQQPDGGFPGRGNPADVGSDLYYTSFALRGLAVLDGLDPTTARRAGEYLRGQVERATSLIDLHALLASVGIVVALSPDPLDLPDLDTLRDRADRCLAPLQREDGWAKSARGGPSSTYHTVLAVTMLHMLGVEPPHAEAIAGMLRGRQRDDGGFVELPPMTRSGTSPTAAAVGVLGSLGGLGSLNDLDRPTRHAAARFLAEMQADDGGVRAHGRIPAGDLLSTFVALTALNEMDMGDRLDRPAVRGFIDRLAMPTGGYRAADLDDTPDAEYTFYGIAAALLSGK
jgi:geranylgeranyl transferase type-2 subunit beta